MVPESSVLQQVIQISDRLWATSRNRHAKLKTKLLLVDPKGHSIKPNPLVGQCSIRAATRARSWWNDEPCWNKHKHQVDGSWPRGSALASSGRSTVPAGEQCSSKATMPAVPQPPALSDGSEKGVQKRMPERIRVGTSELPKKILAPLTVHRVWPTAHNNLRRRQSSRPNIY